MGNIAEENRVNGASRQSLIYLRCGTAREEATAAGLTRARQSERFISEASQGPNLFRNDFHQARRLHKLGFRGVTPGSPLRWAFFASSFNCAAGEEKSENLTLVRRRRLFFEVPCTRFQQIS